MRSFLLDFIPYWATIRKYQDIRFMIAIIYYAQFCDRCQQRRHYFFFIQLSKMERTTMIFIYIYNNSLNKKTMHHHQL